MSQIEATRKSDFITLPRSVSSLVQTIGVTPTVINLKAIGEMVPNNSDASGTVPGLQDTFASIFADGADYGYIAGVNLSDVTGAVTEVIVNAGGSGYTSAPTVAFTASTLVGSLTVTAGGSGYTQPPTVTFSSGGGSGALAVASVQGGQVTGVTIACMGGGYTSAPTVAFTAIGPNALHAGGAAATAVLATATATATVSAGQVTGLTLTYSGAGYGSAGAAAATLSSGGGSGGTATVSVTLNAPSLSATGVGNGKPGGAPGICPRLPNGQGKDAFARAAWDNWIGIVASTSGGTVRIIRSSY